MEPEAPMTMTYDDRSIMPDPPQLNPRQFWNERYSEEPWASGREPNDFLRRQAERIPKGAALCPAEGQGRNAIALAQRGIASRGKT